MESTYIDLALCGGKTLCAMTDNGFSPISEVCDGTVSLCDTTYTCLKTFWSFEYRRKFFLEKTVLIIWSQICGQNGITCLYN